MISKVAGVAVTTCFVVLASSAPAFADNFQKGQTGSVARWYDGSNTLEAVDSVVDGYLAVAQLKKPNGVIVSLAVAADNTYIQQTVNLQENATISLRACFWNGTNIVGCTAWENGTS